METLDDQIKKIVKKINEHDVNGHYSNKQNNCRVQVSSKDNINTKEEVTRLNKRIKSMQNSIELLITDSNKVFKYYHELVNETAEQLQSQKIEFARFKEIVLEQKKQADALIDELTKKVESLNCYIISKQQQFRDLTQKYQQLEQKRETINQIHEELARESEQVIVSNMQIDEMKSKLIETLNINEEYQNQINYLRQLNEELSQNIQYLKNKLDAQRYICYEGHNGAMEQLDRCDVDSISQKFTLQEIKMNDSQEIQEMNLSREKQILNISQHYSKFNRTQQFLSKEKSNYQFIITDSNQGKSFVRRRETAQQNKNILLKIDTIESKDQQIQNKSNSIVITEIKQFKMPDSSQDGPVVDPYHAFFMLLTQCQKINSPIFQRISHIDLTDLYAEFLKKYIPYNCWQKEIQKALDIRSKQTYWTD